MIPPLGSDETPALQIERLERRLAREREARRAAEAIAETSLRDLYREQQRLALVETIATAANLSDHPDEAFALALRAICDFTGWRVGQAYMFADAAPGGPLVFSGVWHDADPELRREFRQISDRLSFDRGEGLPGRVWASGKACWIQDVAADPNFPRAEPAKRAGLHAAFAFPALIGEEVGAVLEFFLERPAPPDEVLLKTLDQIGAQLGRVVERHRNRGRTRAHTLALEEKTAAAEAASRAKSAFLAVTSHEIRTPLNAVLGLSQALQREPLTATQHELNDGVLASGEMLLRLLNAVLDMSKIEADKAVAEMGDFDLRAKLDSILSIWTPRAEEASVLLTLDADLPQARIRTDQGRIEQTLVNLVSNALKFTPAGGEVRIGAALFGDRLRLTVTDGGPGVAPEDRQRIFQPFEQTDAGRDAGGAGLGLAICAGNIALLGGQIGCEPADGVGERFWFDVPVSVAAPIATIAIASPVNATSNDRALRVLAAEDNAGNRRVLEVLLAPAGVELTFAENGEAAVAAALADSFDLILMDVNMPVMDGVEALRLIRVAEGEASHTPIHMLTANAFADDVARYMAGGADGVLTKPIQLPQLFAVLETCLSPVAQAA
ncbi:ATP-binding protein [Brevundimonas sp.]|uniref:ATP-binding protein n=1 Tax=Brevundimonas sp. TaxID=1871086 RepID=UPI0035AF0D2C